MSLDPSIIASDPARSAWVAANAGAGKTHTLANRVARLLLEGAKPERILCLTYTKAAAAEMQERLFTQLGRWSMLPDEELKKQIEIIGAQGGDSERLRGARKLFAQALETPGGLKILTIHAFCQTVLSRFPIEAGISPSFDVLDESSARKMITEARQRILERAGSGEAILAAALAYLVSETSEFQLRSLLQAALGTDRRKLDRFFAGLGRRSFSDALRAAHGIEKDESDESVARGFCAALKHETERLRAVRDWLGAAEGGEAFERLLARDFSSHGFGVLREFFLIKNGTPRKKLAVKKLAEANPDLFEYITALQERFCAAEDRRRRARSAGLVEAALTVIDAVRREYARIKRMHGQLDYDDLIALTSELLGRRDASAWVLYKLDGGIDHLLIDEAQDTSPEQWAIIRKLTEEFFSGAGRPRTLFAVGDEKQSIFSFQGAEPIQFDVNRRHFRGLSTGAGFAFSDEPLLVSRRSAPEILEFIDQVFADAGAREGLVSQDSPLRHEAHRKTAKGRVEFWPSLKPMEGIEVDYWRPVDVESQSSPVARLAERIAEEIKSWIRRGVRLPGHGNPIAPRDIMILLPRREPFGSEIIRQLKLRGIPVAGADRIVLPEQIGAMDLMALGRFALLPEDDLNLAALLRSPLVGLGEEELFVLCHGRPAGLWQSLSDRRSESDTFAAAHDFLFEMRARADYAPPFEFYSHALTALGKRADMLARLGADAADILDEFLSLALDYERAQTPSLEGFLDWMRRGGAEIKRDMERGRNQVRVMTVHGAKGLEADIVILPDTASIPQASAKNGHLLYAEQNILFPLPDAEAPEAVMNAKADAAQEAMKEHRRLLYVALTRARDRLILCGFEGKRGIKPGSWYALAEQAAQALGKKIRRGEEEILVTGETIDEETGTAAEPRSAREKLPDWASSAPLPERAGKARAVRPSDMGGEPAVHSPLGPGGAKRFRRGLLVHALLARLPETPHETRRAIAVRFLRAQGIEQSEAETLADECLAVIEDSVFAAVFADGSRAEVAIVAELPEANLRVNGRLDRFAVTGDTVLLVDFKTNRPPPALEKDVSAAYLAQMALYRAALGRIFPGKRIICALIWTDGPRLMPLSGAILDAEWAKIVSRAAPKP